MMTRTTLAQQGWRVVAVGPRLDGRGGKDRYDRCTLSRQGYTRRVVVLIVLALVVSGVLVEVKQRG